MSVKMWGVASYTLVGTALLLAGGYIAWRCGIDPGDIASWVQAIGSILAIVGAFSLVTIQGRSAWRDKQAAIFAVAHAAFRAAKDVDRALSSNDPESELLVNGHRLIIDSYVGTLSIAPVHELSSSDAITAFLLLRDQFSLLKEAMAICIAGPSRHPHFKEEVDALKDAYMSAENLKRRDERIERQRRVLRRNVEVHIRAIEQRYEQMASALGDIAKFVG
ncbi:hypothetical protein [Cupriavidus necator]